MDNPNPHHTCKFVIWPRLRFCPYGPGPDNGNSGNPGSSNDGGGTGPHFSSVPFRNHQLQRTWSSPSCLCIAGDGLAAWAIEDVFHSTTVLMRREFRRESSRQHQWLGKFQKCVSYKIEDLDILGWNCAPTIYDRAETGKGLLTFFPACFRFHPFPRVISLVLRTSWRHVGFNLSQTLLDHGRAIARCFLFFLGHSQSP